MISAVPAWAFPAPALSVAGAVLSAVFSAHQPCVAPVVYVQAPAAGVPADVPVVALRWVAASDPAADSLPLVARFCQPVEPRSDVLEAGRAGRCLHAGQRY